MCCPGDRSLRSVRASSKDALRSKMEGAHEPTSHFFRHGKRFIFHSYHALRIGPGPCGIVSLVVLHIISVRRNGEGDAQTHDVTACGWWHASKPATPRHSDQVRSISRTVMHSAQHPSIPLPHRTSSAHRAQIYHIPAIEVFYLDHCPFRLLQQHQHSPICAQRPPWRLSRRSIRT
jgi:hypothetical protein